MIHDSGHSPNLLSTCPTSTCTIGAAHTEHVEAQRWQLCAHRFTHMHTHVYGVGTGVYGRGQTWTEGWTRADNR